MQYDRNGTLVRMSQPTTSVRTVKKVLHVDSADRDLALFYTNGEFVVYLPRQYTNVVSLRLKSATFSPISTAHVHFYTDGPNMQGSNFGNDNSYSAPTFQYFMIEIDGLNRSDETAVGANKSGFPDSYFAKISTDISQQVAISDTDTDNKFIIAYNDHTYEENITQFSPPISRLDRLRIRTRLHSQQGSRGFVYWNAGQPASSGIQTSPDANYSLTFEIEYLDNVFDNTSTFETRLNTGNLVR